MNSTSAPSVTALKVEHQPSPLGIDEKRPQMSWTIDTDARGTRQTAYRIRVDTHPDTLTSHAPVLWDTGTIESDESTNIEYAGPALQSHIRYYWSVQISTTTGDSDWSTVTWWEMGLLTPSDWIAKWVRPDQQPRLPDSNEPIDPSRLEIAMQRPLPYENLRPAEYLRREFSVRNSVARARLYATAHGVYRLELNGRRVGDNELAPEWTAYDDELAYQCHDITEYLSEGQNAVGMIIADGWYAGRVGVTGAPLDKGDHVEGLLQLEIEYLNGSVEIVASDSEFVSSTGPIRYSDFLIGERYDARAELNGWSSPGFDAKTWSAVAETGEALTNLVAFYGEPVKVIEELPGQRVLHSPAGETIIDFGQVIAGRTRMRVQGPAGTEVRLRHTQTLDADGNFFSNIAGVNADATDVYVLKGGDIEEFEAAFTYRGFRYVMLQGYPGTPTPADFTAIAMSSDTTVTAELETDNADVNRLFSNVIQTIRANMFSVPTDNPDRERGGWTGDFQAIAPTVMTTLGLESFTTRWLRSLRAEQYDDGAVPFVIPNVRAYADFFHSVGAHAGSAWGDVCVIAPWTAYQVYGDIRILDESYESGTRWLDYCAAAAAESRTDEDNADPSLDHVWRNTTFGFGDWLVPSVTTVLESGIYALDSGVTELIPTIYWARSADLMSRTAAVLGRTTDAVGLADLAVSIKRSFCAAFLSEDGRLSEDKQGMYVLALEFDLVPPEQRARLFDRLVQLIDENNSKLDTGFLSTAFVLPLLTRYGRSDLAYRLLLSEENPSWLYQVQRGATSVWEMWDSIQEDGTRSRTSHIQPGLSTVGLWLLQTVGGISPAAPGYREFLIHPVPGPGFNAASARFDSIHGRATCSWQKSNAGLRLDVEIPANTSARIVVDGARADGATESDAPLRDSAFVVIESEEAGLQLEVPSGRYSFMLELDPPSHTVNE